MQGLPERLARRGWNVHVAASSGPRLSAASRERFLAAHAIDMRRKPAPVADVRAFAQWLRLLRRVKPDVVLIGTPKAAFLGLLAAALLRIPLRIYHLRGMRLETETGFARLLYWVIEKLTFASSTSVLSVSESVKQLVTRLNLTKESKVTVLGRGSSNGVDITRFQPSRESRVASLRRVGLEKLDPSVPTVGFVGRLTIDKGVRVLLKASRLLTERQCQHRLVLVGPFEDAALDAERVKVQNLANPPVFVGPVDDVRPYYRVFDIVCLPSFREGFPNVALEAAASGLPMVTTNATGAVDAILDQVTGITTTVGDADALAGALMRLLASQELRASMGIAGRRMVETYFARDSVQTAIAEYIECKIGQH